MRRERPVDPLMAEFRTRRLEIGLTQAELSYRAGIDETTIRKCEAGKVSPMLTTLRAWAGALGVDLRMEAKG